ncbi:MAG: aldehyde dehydrogenase family protein [Spirochaetota bacterium]
MTLEGSQIIAGQLRAAGTDRAQAVSPATGAPLPASFAHATAGEVDDAVTAAFEAWGEYRRLTPAHRARFLRRIADEIEALGDDLIERCHLETGLTAGRLEGERGRTCSQLRLFADVIEEGSWVDARITTALPDRSPAPRPDIRRMLVSLGPVVVFGASNFPLAFSVAGGDTASALAAGCPVIVKAHSSHPGTSELVARAIVRAAQAEQVPPGVFSMLHGPGTTVGIRLVEHEHVTAVGFTGSYAGGRALFDAAARRPKPIPVYAEMGSINPVFVLPGAASERAEQIAAGLTGSVTLGVGQFCTNPGLVVGLEGEAFDGLASATGREVSGVEAGTMLNARTPRAFRRFERTSMSSRSPSAGGRIPTRRPDRPRSSERGRRRCCAIAASARRSSAPRRSSSVRATGTSSCGWRASSSGTSRARSTERSRISQTTRIWWTSCSRRRDD